MAGKWWSWIAGKALFGLGGAALLMVMSYLLPASAPDPVALAAAAPSSSPVADAASIDQPAVVPAVIPAAAGPAPVFAVNTVLELDRPLGSGDYVWSEEGAPDGPMTIVVDIEAQRLYAYRGGVEIGRSSIIYGDDDKPTPLGTFPILEKDADHVSNLYGAPMPYMLRLTWDGIAIHGSEVDEWSATHGCIGVPEDFAATLFANARIGDRVLVTNGWMTEEYS